MTLQTIRTLGLAALALATTLSLHAANTIPDECKQGGDVVPEEPDEARVSSPVL